MHKILYLNKPIETSLMERLMKYGIGYITTTDYIIDDVKKKNSGFKEEYDNNIRPNILKTIKYFSEKMLDEDKEKFSMGVNPDMYFYFLIGIRHYLDTNIHYYIEHHVNVMKMDMEVAKKDFEFVDGQIKNILQILEQLRNED